MMIFEFEDTPIQTARMKVVGLEEPAETRSPNGGTRIWKASSSSL